MWDLYRPYVASCKNLDSLTKAAVAVVGDTTPNLFVIAGYVAGFDAVHVVSTSSDSTWKLALHAEAIQPLPAVGGGVTFSIASTDRSEGTSISDANSKITPLIRIAPLFSPNRQKNAMSIASVALLPSRLEAGLVADYNAEMQWKCFTEKYLLVCRAHAKQQAKVAARL